MLTEIKTSLSSLKIAMDMAKTVKGITDQAKIDIALADMREAIINAQEKVLESQEKAHQILEERANLVKQLKEETEKNNQIEQYKLIEPRAGVFLYLFQPENNNETPSHTACPNCFKNKTISILQHSDSHSHAINCHACNFSYDPRTPEEIEKLYNEAVIHVHDDIHRF